MATITNFSQLDPNGVYSYADYLSWKFDQALEIIRGKIFKMAAPSIPHQRLSWDLTLIIGNHFKKYPCKAFASPIDVRLFDKKKSIKADKDIFTVVQPDLCIICDLEKIKDKRGCLGAPDLVVEILSPGNSIREMKIKKELYAESGVREYWIVDPTSETVTRFHALEDGSFSHPFIFVSDETMPSVIFPEFNLILSDLFPPTGEEDL